MINLKNNKVQGIYLGSPGDNMLMDTNRNITSSDYLIAEYPLSEIPVVGETYTITVWGKLAETKSSFGIYNTNGTCLMASLTKNTQIREGVYSTTFVWTNTTSYGTIIVPTKILVYTLYSSQTGVSSINKIKLEKGVNRNPSKESSNTGKIIQRIYRGGPNNLLKNSKTVIVGSNSNIWNNVTIYFDTPFEIKAGEKLTISVEGIEVLEGSATEFTVYLYNRSNESNSGYGTSGVITKDKPYITLTASLNTTANSIILYAGKSGQASGISVKYSKVMCVKGTTPAPFWTPAPSEATEDSCVVYKRDILPNLLNGTNDINSLDRTLDVWKAPWEQGKWRITSDSTGDCSLFNLSAESTPPNSPGFMYSMDNGKVNVAQDLIPVTLGKTYTLSIYAEGTGVIVLGCGKNKKTFLIGHTFKRYYFTFDISEDDLEEYNTTSVYFGIESGFCEFTGPKLEETINPYTKWTNAPVNLFIGSKNGFTLGGSDHPEDTSFYTTRNSEGFFEYTMRVIDNSSNRNYGRYGFIRSNMSEYFQEGETYTLSVDVKSNAPGSLFIEIYKSSVNNYKTVVMLSFESTNNEWERISKTFNITGLGDNNSAAMTLNIKKGSPIDSCVTIRKMCLVKGNFKGYVPAESELTNNLVKLSLSEYNSMSNRNSNTLYCIEDGGYIQRIYQGDLSYNLLTNSDALVHTNSYFLKSYYFTETPKVGETYTITIWGKLGEGKTAFGIYDSQGMANQINLTQISGIGEHVYTGTFKWRGSNTEYLRVYSIPSSVSSFSTIREIKLEKGETPDPVYNIHNSTVRKVFQQNYIKGKLASTPASDGEHALKNADGSFTVIPYDSDTLEFNMIVPGNQSIISYSNSSRPSKIKEIKIVGKAIGDNLGFCNFYQECTSIDVSEYDVSEATNLSKAFYANKVIETLDLHNWQTYKNTSLQGAFYLCSKLKSLNVKGWNTSNVTHMGDLFVHDVELETLDLSSWDFGKVVNGKDMFWDCPKLTNLTFGYNWKNDLRVHWNPLLTHTSALSILNGLATVTNAPTITFAQATYDTLTPEEIAIATNKGWNIASI